MEQEDCDTWLVEHREWIGRTVRACGVPADEVEDCVQEVCLRLFLHWEEWADRGGDRSRKPWAKTIATNYATDWHRFQHAQKRTLRWEWQVPLADPEHMALVRLCVLECWTVLSELEQWLVAATAMGWLYREQADLRQIPLGTLKRHHAEMHHRMNAYA